MCTPAATNFIIVGTSRLLDRVVI